MLRWESKLHNSLGVITLFNVKASNSTFAVVVAVREERGVGGISQVHKFPLFDWNIMFAPSPLWIHFLFASLWIIQCKFNESGLMVSFSEVTECFKMGLVCNNGTICEQDSDGYFNCVCHKGFEMVSAGGNITCQGKNRGNNNQSK